MSRPIGCGNAATPLWTTPRSASSGSATLPPSSPSTTIGRCGFDDIATASQIRPRLDTVAVDKLAMGRVAVAMLVHRIRYPNDPAFTVVQRAELVVRESAAPPR